MNKLGLHGFVWTENWSAADAEMAIRNTAALGFDLIEASAMDLTAFDVPATVRALAEAKLGITMSFGLNAERDISSTDRDCVNRGRNHLLDALAIARDVGATHVCGILYSAFQKYYVPPTPEGIKNAIGVVQEVAAKAQASGITLGLEVVNRYESNLLNTASQAIDFVKRVDMPNVKIHLDTYHMNIEEADAGRAIRDAGPLLGYVHTGDSHRGYLGSGSVDFPAIFRALAEISYEGPITFESFSSAIVSQPLEGILGIWRNLWNDSHDLAKHAKMFTDVQLKSALEAVHRRSSNGGLPSAPNARHTHALAGADARV